MPMTATTTMRASTALDQSAMATRRMDQPAVGDVRGSIMVGPLLSGLKSSRSSIALAGSRHPMGAVMAASTAWATQWTSMAAPFSQTSAPGGAGSGAAAQRSSAASWRLMPRATALMGGARRATSAREASTMSEMAPRTFSSASRMGTPTEAELRPISMRVME